MGVLSKIRESEKFSSYEESENFEDQIAFLISTGRIEEVSVESPEHPLLEEHWYKDLDTGEIYRYCPPEFPSRGVWRKVN